MTARRPVRRPRVLLVHYTSPSVLGGVEQVMGAHAAALRDHGADVRIAAGRGRASPRGVPLVRIPELDSKHPLVLRDFRALARGNVGEGHGELVARIARRLRPHVERADRVVVHNAFTLHKNAALTVALGSLAAEHPGRFIAWTHDLAWTDAQYDSERHAGEPWDRFARAAAGVRYVAVSAERADELARLMGISRRDIVVVPNGVDVAAVLGLSAAGARLAQRLGLWDAEPLILLPARLTRRKRVEVAIAAHSELRARGHPSQIVITGSPGAHNATNRAYAAELAALAERTEGTHLLHALGFRASYRLIADLFALSDVMVLPSGNEGFGIPLLEAGAHRVPVVCSDIPALRGLGGEDATYVPPDASGRVVADAIERCLARDSAYRLRLRAKAHAWPRVLREHVLPVILG